MTAYGYARVSTLHQNLALQLDALVGRAGIPESRITTEYASGAVPRPKLEALVAKLKPGDVLTVWRLDRLGRSLQDLLALTERLHAREIELRSLAEGLCTATPHGRLVWSLLAAVAQYERELLAERRAAGIQSARARGKRLGRPPAVTDSDRELLLKLAQEGATHRELAARFRCSIATVSRIVRDHLRPIELGD